MKQKKKPDLDQQVANAVERGFEFMLQAANSSEDPRDKNRRLAKIADLRNGYQAIKNMNKPVKKPSKEDKAYIAKLKSLAFQGNNGESWGGKK